MTYPFIISLLSTGFRLYEVYYCAPNPRTRPRTLDRLGPSFFFRRTPPAATASAPTGRYLPVRHTGHLKAWRRNLCPQMAPGVTLVVSNPSNGEGLVQPQRLRAIAMRPSPSSRPSDRTTASSEKSEPHQTGVRPSASLLHQQRLPFLALGCSQTNACALRFDESAGSAAVTNRSRLEAGAPSNGEGHAKNRSRTKRECRCRQVYSRRVVRRRQLVMSLGSRSQGGK